MKVHIHATGQYSLNGTADEFLEVANRMSDTAREIRAHRETMPQFADIRHQVDFVLPEVSEVWNEGPIWQGPLPPAERVSTYEANVERPKTSLEKAFVPGLLELPSRLAAAKAGIPWPLKPKKPAKAKAKKKVRR